MKIIGEPINEYHAHAAISNSKLKEFADSTLRFYERYIAKIIPAEKSPAFDFGSAFHALMEGEQALQAVAVVNTQFDSFRTADAKAWKAAVEADGKIILTPDDITALRKMEARVKSNKLVQRLIEGTEAEVTFRQSFGKYAIQCRADRYREHYEDDKQWKGPLLLDWKTLPSIGDFRKNVVNYSYHMQAAFYSEVVAACLELPEDAMRPRVIFIACEKEPPYECQPFECDAKSMDLARGQVFMELARLKRCYETGVWTRPEEIESVTMPFWYTRAAEERLLEQKARLQLETTP